MTHCINLDFEEWIRALSESHKTDCFPHNEVGSAPYYEGWKDDEQDCRLKRDIARLQSDEKDNYLRIIEAQAAYIKWLEEYLDKNEEYINALRVFYEQQRQENNENHSSRGWINLESYEERSDPHYEAWKKMRQTLMKRNAERLQNAENQVKK